MARKAFLRGQKVLRLGIQKKVTTGANVGNLFFDGKIFLGDEKNLLPKKTADANDEVDVLFRILPSKISSNG
jgi:hypothetical protein